jgi:MFS family permease
MAVTASSVSSERGVLDNRDFRLYLAGLFVGTLAIQIQSVAVGWQVYNITSSPLALGYVGLAQFLPMAACTLPAGNIADRFERRLIIVIGYLAQAVAAGLFLALSLMKVSEMGAFYAVLALFAAARAFPGPASQSFVPMLVPQERFPQAVAWSSATSKIAVIVGPAIGGAIYILGPAVAYGVCLILFIVVAMVTTAMRTASRYYTEEPGVTGLGRVAAGIAYVRGNPIILGAISLDLFAVLLGGATALLPIYARDILRVGREGLGLLRSAPALGAVFLGFVLGRVPIQRNAGAVMFAAVTIFGIATIVFGLSGNFFLSMAALAVLGASDMASVYVRGTVVQLATPDAMRGRVSAVNRLFIGASNELGEFESGVTASWFGTVPSVVIGGIGTLVVVVLGLCLFPSLREIDKLTDVAT